MTLLVQENRSCAAEVRALKASARKAEKTLQGCRKAEEQARGAEKSAYAQLEELRKESEGLSQDLQSCSAAVSAAEQRLSDTQSKVGSEREVRLCEVAVTVVCRVGTFCAKDDQLRSHREAPTLSAQVRQCLREVMRSCCATGSCEGSKGVVRGGGEEGRRTGRGACNMPGQAGRPGGGLQQVLAHAGSEQGGCLTRPA